MILLIETEVIQDVLKKAFFGRRSRLIGGCVRLPLATPFFFKFLGFVTNKTTMKTNRVFRSRLSSQVAFETTLADAANEDLDVKVAPVRHLHLGQLLPL